MEVRLDKWLSVAQIFKTRTQATRACTLGRVTVNGVNAKAHRLLALEDRIEVEQGDWVRILIVKELREKSLPKAEARRLYEDHSPERPKLDLVDKILRQPPVHRQRGAGRPTKKERRQLRRNLLEDGSLLAD